MIARALALVVLLAVAGLVADSGRAAAADVSPAPPVGGQLEAPPAPWPGDQLPVLQADQSVRACAGASLAAGAFVSLVGTPVFGAGAALTVGALCAVNIVTGGAVADLATGPLLSATEGVLATTLGSFLRDALAAVLDAFFGALGPDGNVVSQTPAALTYEMGVVVDMHRYAMVFTFICLGGIVLWGGFNVMLRKEAKSPYAGPMELFGRVVLAMILVALSMSLMKGVIEVNNAAICYFGGLVEVVGDQGLTAPDESFEGLCSTTESGELNVVHPPGFSRAFEGGDGLLDIAFGMAYALVLLALIILMVMRIGLIDVLIVLAPIAALLWVLPQTQQWTSRWTNMFPLTVFQQAAQMIVLALGVTIASTAAGVISGPSRAEAAPSEVLLECDPVPSTEEARSASMRELCALHQVQGARAALERSYGAQRAALDSHMRATNPPGTVAGLLPNPDAIEADIDRLAGEIALAYEREFDAVLMYAGAQSPAVAAAHREYLAARSRVDTAAYTSEDRLRLHYEMRQDNVLLRVLEAVKDPAFDCTYQSALSDEAATEDIVLRTALCSLPHDRLSDSDFTRIVSKLGHRVEYWQHLLEGVSYVPPDRSITSGVGDLLLGTREDLERGIVLMVAAAADLDVSLATRRGVLRAAIESLAAQESVAVADSITLRDAARRELQEYMGTVPLVGAPITQEQAALQAEARLDASNRALGLALSTWLPAHLQGEDVNPFHGSTSNAIYLMFAMGLLWLVIQMPGILNGQALQGGLRQILPVAFGLKMAAGPMGALASRGAGSLSRATGAGRAHHAAGGDMSQQSGRGAFGRSLGNDFMGRGGGGSSSSPASLLARDDWNNANPDRAWSSLSRADQDSSTQAMANKMRDARGGPS